MRPSERRIHDVARQESAVSRLWPQAAIGVGAPEAPSAIRSVDQKPAYGAFGIYGTNAECAADTTTHLLET